MLSKYFCVALASEITSANEGAMSSYKIAKLELHAILSRSAHNIMKLRILRNAQRLRSLCGDQRLRSLRRYDQRLQSLCRYLTFQAYMQQHKYLDQRLQSLCRDLTLQAYMQQQIYLNNASKYRNTHNCLNTIIKPNARGHWFFQAANPYHSGNESISAKIPTSASQNSRSQNNTTEYELHMHILQNMNYICPCYVKSTCMIMH